MSIEMYDISQSRFVTKDAKIDGENGYYFGWIVGWKDSDDFDHEGFVNLKKAIGDVMDVLDIVSVLTGFLLIKSGDYKSSNVEIILLYELSELYNDILDLKRGRSIDFDKLKKFAKIIFIKDEQMEKIEEIGESLEEFDLDYELDEQLQ